MWSYKVLVTGYRGYRGVKYFIARLMCLLHAIRRYQVLNALRIINNNNHENVKYAATKIVNKMATVEDLNGFLDKKLDDFVYCIYTRQKMKRYIGF